MGVRYSLMLGCPLNSVCRRNRGGHNNASLTSARQDDSGPSRPVQKFQRPRNALSRVRRTACPVIACGPLNVNQKVRYPIIAYKIGFGNILPLITRERIFNYDCTKLRVGVFFFSATPFFVFRLDRDVSQRQRIKTNKANSDSRT